MKIVFTTPVGNTPDYFSISVTSKFPRFSLPTPAFGLRFIKQNIPEIEILEYPTWEEYIHIVKNGVDILGISFYMRDIPKVLKMIEFARKNGVKEIWGGNYGVLTYGIEEYFDKIFIGYAEREIAKELGYEIKRVKHPPLITNFGIYKTPFKISHAFLFSNRGCPFKCSFCQTPIATKGIIERIPLESVEEVIRKYKKMGMKSVFLMDDNFFADRKHSEKVIDLLGEYKLNWGVCTRIENLYNRIEEFMEKGMFMSLIGLESFRQENLDSVRKGYHSSILLDTLNQLIENNIYIHGTYILGFENDTKKSIKEDIKKLSKMRIGSLQITILTPLPRTKLWEEIESKYGIFEKDLSKFDTYHLVWNHPNIRAKEMEKLLEWARRTCFPPWKIMSDIHLVAKNGMLKRFIFQ
ncbi:MAG: radical SAM protein [Candidatus Aenigmarchaeota archaeon]|nr:radical SAM protein [Candidatus Aenigmarchaeota archaeon]